jgi:signal transduction histidine kinase/PAS domain-containing protein
MPRQSELPEDLRHALADTAVRLIGLLDPQIIAEALADRLVPTWADIVAIDLLSERIVVASHREPAHAGRVVRIRRTTPHVPDANHLGNAVLRDRAPALILDPERRLTEKDPHQRFSRELGLSRLLVAPLQADGESIGLMTLGSLAHEAGLDERSWVLVDELGRMVGAALSAARRYRAVASELQSKSASLRAAETLLDSPLAPILVLDRMLVITHANAAAVALVGRSARALLGRRAESADLPGGADLEDAMRRVAAGSAPTESLDVSTSERWPLDRRTWSAVCHAVQGEGAAVIAVSVLFVETTRATRDAERAKIVADAAVRLSGARDASAIGSALLHAVVGPIADWGVVHVAGDGAPRAVASVHRDRSRAEAARALPGCVDRRGRPRGHVGALATGRPDLLAPEEVGRLADDDPALARVIAVVGGGAQLAFPIALSGRPVAVLTLGRRGEVPARVEFLPLEIGIVRDVAALASDGFRARGAELSATLSRALVIDLAANFARRIGTKVRDTLADLQVVAAEDPALGAALERTAAAIAEVDRELRPLATIAPPSLGPEPARSRIDLGDLAADAVARIASELRARAVTTSIHVERGATVRADRDALAHVVELLVRQAARHVGDGGMLTVHVEAHGQEATLAVSETGGGYAADESAVIFDALWRPLEGVDPRLTEVRALVETHGGRAWVESARGAGASYWIGLPLERARA